MNEKQYDIFYILNRFINDTSDSIDSILAKYFIDNYYDAKNFNIYNIAAECNVSRASIRRFAEKIGYKNFQNLKKEMILYSKKPQNLNKINYRKQLTNTIVSMTEELNQRMDTNQVSVICRKIKEAVHFYIICFGASLSAVKDFQVRLSAQGKIFKLVHNREDIQALKEIVTKEDLLIVISISGRSALAYQDMFKKLDMLKMLVTVDRIDDFSDDYDDVYFLSHLDHSHDPSMYRKYGLNYFLDILANEYE
ncbi:DNA-binding MurR/RpiR family transcriptional regulator [Lactobacillus colini]|uniref:DNA-binding MurR/RpiR family transcriptional regulator n=1 Tax=Lactobacillus colini TaxID=1819254 RepID=A0ABS4MEH2_9LACO|nr:MurR/RpiR family transcriptional regulator [Lactobacillus colini]MBP2058092.1 DNA-binding MurR/RpiR family transcriptional regulator [Lactobacillus colini]